MSSQTQAATAKGPPMSRPHADLLWDSFCELAKEVGKLDVARISRLHDCFTHAAFTGVLDDALRSDVLAIFDGSKPAAAKKPATKRQRPSRKPPAQPV